MNAVLNYAHSQAWGPSKLVKLPNPDAITRAGRVYTESEIESLWAVMGEETRDQFALCFECMMRLREALYLAWDRINLETGEITLRAEDVKTGSKTGRGRSFIASPMALARLRQRRAETRSSYVFPNPKGSGPIRSNKTAWRAAKRKAGITGRARWHDLRHTALSRALLDARVNVVLVSEYAGVSIKTLQRVYLHSDSSKTATVADAVSVARRDFGGTAQSNKGDET
jgi:integrase